MLENGGPYEITKRAHRDAAICGYFSPKEIIAEVCSLRHSDFDKSMTREGNHTIWQDAYKVTRVHPQHPDRSQKLYIKVQENPVGTGVVISFHLDT